MATPMPPSPWGVNSDVQRRCQCYIGKARLLSAPLKGALTPSPGQCPTPLSKIKVPKAAVGCTLLVGESDAETPRLSMWVPPTASALFAPAGPKWG